MIGSLLFYAFYPLSRYLLRRRSEAANKGLPPSAVNGRTVWDGGTVTVRDSQSETILLNQTGETMGDAKERMRDPVQKQDKTQLDMSNEPLTTVLQKDTNDDAPTNMSAIQSVTKENGETPKLEDDELVIPPMKACTEGKSTSTDDINSHQELVAQLKHLQTDESIQEDASQAQEQIQSETLKTSEESNPCFEDEQLQDKTACKVTEFWDEYLVPSGDLISNAAGNNEFLLASILSDTQTHHDLDVQQDAQTSWHFPAGPGLAQEVECPLWHFPAPSYYPQMELTMPIEVVWRVWEELEQSAKCALIPFPFNKASMDFTVMSYNILAPDLLEANKHLYVHCPLEVLDWSYRCSLLLKEIESWTPDILCLQEVQENHYYEQLYPVLSQMGYTCVYKRRTGTKTDGCATCYRSTCFAEVAVTKLEYFRPDSELLDRHNVGIVLLLRPLVVQGAAVKEVGPPLCVANTHLLFNPKRGDVKLAQLAIMLAEIDAMIKSCKAKGEHCNVVLCGDFNSLPHMPLYQLITASELYYQGLPAWMISGQEDLSYKLSHRKLYAPLWPSSLGVTDNCQYTTNTNNDTCESQSQKSGKLQYTHEFMLQLRYCPAGCVRPQDLVLIPGVTDIKPDPSGDNQQHNKWFRHSIRHRLDLESVYKHVLPGSGSPEITTLHSEGGATVDYIFYSPKRNFAFDQKASGTFAGEGLQLTGCLSLLSEDVLWSMNGLPNHVFPSDHLSLVARFQLDLNTS